jgi:hypothetical protein
MLEGKRFGEFIDNATGNADPFCERPVAAVFSTGNT